MPGRSSVRRARRSRRSRHEETQHVPARQPRLRPPPPFKTLYRWPDSISIMRRQPSRISSASRRMAGCSVMADRQQDMVHVPLIRAVSHAMFGDARTDARTGRDAPTAPRRSCSGRSASWPATMTASSRGSTTLFRSDGVRSQAVARGWSSPAAGRNRGAGCALRRDSRSQMQPSGWSPK